jgi:hypothetical protein
MLSYEEARKRDPRVDSWMLLSENAALSAHGFICEDGPELPKEEGQEAAQEDGEVLEGIPEDGEVLELVVPPARQSTVGTSPDSDSGSLPPSDGGLIQFGRRVYGGPGEAGTV